MKSSCLFSTFLLIGWVCSSLLLSAQTAPIALPPTPEAQSLLKTVNMQVNKSTGIAGFSIPLYEAQVGGIRVPIVLSYSCAALKVRDIASWVGTGWNLAAGGKITRVVVDRDDLEGGYAQGQGRTAQNLAGWWDGASVKEERKERHAGDPCTGCLGFDGEPDLFYYEIPGRSGMFVIDYTGKAWTIPYSNLKIELRSDQSFVITDEAANRYFFTQKERTYETSHSDRAHTGNSGSPYGEESEVRSYISTWHLTRIENLAGEQITFSYQLGAEISYENNSYIQFDTEEIEDKSVHFRTTPFYLSSISWRRGYLQFISSASRSDMAGCRQLDEIKIYAPSSVYRKSVKFTYSQFSSKRLRLDQITEVSGTLSVVLGKYEYYTDYNLPSRDSKDIDHWGYYNGRGNTGWLPANTGCDRSPSFPHVRANLMKKAYNSLGGYTEYEYEANRISSSKEVGGVRIKTIRTGDADGGVQTVSYTYSNGTSFNTNTIYSNAIGNKQLKYSYSTLNLHDTGGSNVYYGEVTETLSNGSRITSRYTTYADRDSQDVPSTDYINPSEGHPNGEISLFPNSSRFWRRGLLKEEIHASATGAEVKRVVNTYLFPSAPKQRIQGFFLQSFSTALGVTIDHLVVYDWLSEPIYLVHETITDTYALDVDREVVFDTAYCMPVEETTTHENGDVLKTVKKYAFSYLTRHASAGQVEANAIALLHTKGLHLVPIETVHYKNGQVVGGKLITYKSCLLEKGKEIPVPAKEKSLISLPIEENDFLLSVRNTVSQFIHDPRYETIRTFDSYGLTGKLLSWREKNGIPHSVVYTADETEVIAQVEHAKYAVPDWAEVQDSTESSYYSGYPTPFYVESPGEVEFRITDLSLTPTTSEYMLILEIYEQGALVAEEVKYFNDMDRPFRLYLLDGELTLHFRAMDMAGDSLQVDTRFYIIQPVLSRENDVRNNQVFYTSFEDDSKAETPIGKARTGDKAYRRALEMDLKNMVPGNYLLSYWQSQDDGTTWLLVENPLEITATSRTHTIGSTAYLIDEVRLLPRQASLTSVTSIPGIGKTSETDINGLTVYYEYDALGRLVRVLDNERRVTRAYQYYIHFK